MLGQSLKAQGLEDYAINDRLQADRRCDGVVSDKDPPVALIPTLGVVKACPWSDSRVSEALEIWSDWLPVSDGGLAVLPNPGTWHDQTVITQDAIRHCQAYAAQAKLRLHELKAKK